MPALDFILRLVDRFSGPAGAAGGAAAALSTRLGGVQSAMAKTEKAAKSSGGAMSSFVGNIGSRALEMGKDAVVSGVTFAANAFQTKEDILFGMTKLLGGTDAAQAAWAQVASTSKLIGKDQLTIGTQFQTLMAQGFDLSATDKLVKQMADLAAINPTANLEGIVRAIGQIKATGRLQGDELMQLNEAGLSAEKVYERIAKKVGVATSEVTNLQAAGKISAKVAIESIQEAITEMTGGAEAGSIAAQKSLSTTSGLIDRIKGRAIEGLLSLGGAGGGGGFLSNFAAAFEGAGGAALFESISSSIQKITKALGFEGVGVEGITGALQTMGGVFSFIADRVVTFITVWKTVGGVIAPVIGFVDDLFGKVAAVFGFEDVHLVDVLGFVADAAIMAAAPFGAMIMTFQFLAGAVESVRGALSGVAASMESARASAREWISNLDFSDIASSIVDKAASVGSSIIDGIVNGISGGASRVVGAITGAVGGAIDAAESLLEIGSPSKLFHRYGEWTAEGFARGIDDGAPEAQGAMSGMVSPEAVGMSAGGSSSVSTDASKSVSMTVTIYVGSGDPAAIRAELEKLLEAA